MITERELTLTDGRRLHLYDTDAQDHARLSIFWHHGTPNIGAPPVPLLPYAAEHGVRWVSYDRPGYGASSSNPGRDVASAASDVSAIADALGIAQFAVMSHSGGGPHALACAALLPDRVLGAACVAGLAPFDASELDWFAGMAPAGTAELRAARAGRGQLEDQLASTDFDPSQFTASDHAALAGPWSWLGAVAEQGLAGGTGGMVDDDLAYVHPWGFDPAEIVAPVLCLHGGEDRIVPATHGQWLSHRIPAAELWLRPGEGHISVLGSAESAMRWLTEHSMLKGAI